MKFIYFKGLYIAFSLITTYIKCKLKDIKDPLKINKPEHSKKVYEKALPIHYEREYIQGDGLTELKKYE